MVSDTTMEVYASSDEEYYCEDSEEEVEDRILEDLTPFASASASASESAPEYIKVNKIKEERICIYVYVYMFCDQL